MSNKHSFIRSVYKGKILTLNVEKDSWDSNREWEVVRKASVVSVVAITPEGKTVFVKQHRYPVGETLLELPCGHIDVGETAKQAGKRELKEETGYEAEDMYYLGHFYVSPGFTDEAVTFYLAKVGSKGEQALGEDEKIEVVELSWDIIRSSRIAGLKTKAGLLLAKEHLTPWPEPSSYTLD